MIININNFALFAFTSATLSNHLIDVTSIYVYGNDVYVTGSVRQNTPYPGYWKNGQWTPLTYIDGWGDNLARGANSVFVIDNDVYVAGIISDGFGGGLATYWKNGVATILNHNPGSKANSIFVTHGSNTGINDVTQENINIYPNPVKDELYIDIPFFEKMEYLKNVEICDLTGRTVGALRAMPLQEGNATINVSALPSGVYFVKITTDNGIVTKKFIKE